MNKRRNFIMQSGLATAALLVAKPFNAIAKHSSPFFDFGFNSNNITFLHTTTSGFNMAAKVKNNYSNIVLLHSGNESQEKMQELKYDASTSLLDDNFEGSYKIVYKGNIKAGIISANGSNTDIDHLNSLSAFLKKEKNCQVVVCLSQLGYKNKNSVDDISLAGKSENIDIIIGKNTATSPAKPVIKRNKNKSEVIIHHSENSETAIGTIKIGFDKSGFKNNISFK